MTGSLHALDALPAVSLDELNSLASLQTRTDRKYLVTLEQLEVAIDSVAERARSLEIDGERVFTYESVYFDTPMMHSYLGAARRRPDRFKVRTRSYLDRSGVEPCGCAVEVKLRDRRGRTVKHRRAHEPESRSELTPGALDFVDSFQVVRPLSDGLRPVLTTSYRRSTLLLDGASRATIDADVTCLDGTGGAASFGARLVLETKSAGSPSELDRVLWSMHIRPERLSKFGIGLAALRPALPSNTWHRVLRRHVTVLSVS